MTEHEKLSGFKLGFNFAVAVTDEVGAIMRGEEAVSQDEAKRRHDICKKCPYRRHDDRCDKCGCYTSIKSSWRTQKCPIGKW